LNGGVWITSWFCRSSTPEISLNSCIIKGETP
jgi:hypothetical protein